MSKSFIAYGLDGNKKEVIISNDAYISNNRCQRCGCNLINETNEWSSNSECPICFYRYNENYLNETEIRVIDDHIDRIIKELNFYNNLSRVIKGENKVREKNIKNEPEVKEDV